MFKNQPAGNFWSKANRAQYRIKYIGFSVNTKKCSCIIMQEHFFGREDNDYFFSELSSVSKIIVTKLLHLGHFICLNA